MKSIVLTAAHEHDGRPFEAGSELLLADVDADWLIGASKAKPHAAKAAPAPKATESTQDKEQQA